MPMSAPRFPDRLVYTVQSRGDARDELLAMCAWRARERIPPWEVFLTSLDGTQEWDGPVLESPWSPNEPPGRGKGVRAFKRCRRRLWCDGWCYGQRVEAWGWVALSGLVEETPAGYRAQVAVIRQIRIGPAALAHFATASIARTFCVELLEERYRCPVKIGYPEWRVSRTMISREAR
jgi:hypothetical protein